MVEDGMEAERVIVGQSKYEFNRLVLMYRNKDRFTHHIFKYSPAGKESKSMQNDMITNSLFLEYMLSVHMTLNQSLIMERCRLTSESFYPDKSQFFYLLSD